MTRFDWIEFNDLVAVAVVVAVVTVVAVFLVFRRWR